MPRNQEIQFKILNKHLDKLEELKPIIIDKWLNYKDVINFFTTKESNFDVFIANFGLNIFDNMLQSIKENDTQNYSVIKEKLRFFKRKNTSSEEIFIICKDLRRAVKTVIFHNIDIAKNDIYTTIVEIDVIFDNSLKNILGYYSELIIDDIHKSQKNYVENLKMYEQIVEHMTESVWIGDDEEKTVYANPEFCKTLGYTLEEMLGRESYDFWDEESIEIVKNNNQIRVKGEASKYEGVLKAKDGTLIPVLLSGASIPGGGTVGIMTNLSEIKTLQEAKDELKQLNQQKDEFISLVGHELRTPLTAIKGYLSMILDGDMGEIDGTLQSSVSQSFKSSERMLELVNDMLDLSRIQSGRMAYNMNTIGINSILNDTYNVMKIIFQEKNINFELIKSEEIDNINVHVDQNKLKQVIINLLNNAAKFTPEDGDVKLVASIKENRLLIEIIDTGIGIPEDKIKKVFDKFYQVDSYIQRKVEGLGLGLSLSQRFIKQFNSSLKLKSEEGKGSNFYFSLKII